MKQYKKTYEDVYSSDWEKSNTKLNLDKITVPGFTLEEYTVLFKGFLDRSYLELFDQCVRLSWLRRKFTYYEMKTALPMQNNARILNTAFVKFMRRNVGRDLQIITKGRLFTKLELLFDDLFPGFCDGNPFENPEYYKFPYKNISTDFLLTVHQLDDRLELLKYADEQNMSYAVFLDYLINRFYCINEELGRDRFQVWQERHCPLYIKDSDKELAILRGKKRK